MLMETFIKIDTEEIGEAPLELKASESRWLGKQHKGARARVGNRILIASLVLPGTETVGSSGRSSW